MMNSSSFQVWEAGNPLQRQNWEHLWLQWPDREVFAHPEYAQLYAKDGVKAMCATYSNGPGHVLYPFLFRPLDLESEFGDAALGKADIVSPYGYGGAFQWGNREGSKQFWDLLGNWCQKQGIVSEVIRFSLFENSILPYSGERKSVSENVVRDLDTNEADLWRGFEHKVRKNVNRAKASGIQIRIDETGEDLKSFLSIYRATMDRRNANDTYYFPASYFEQMHAKLPGQFVYFYAEQDGKVVSAELVLVSASRVYSFLGGTESEYFPMRPNDFLKVQIMLWAQAKGKKQFVLGGGYEPGDGIYRYKLSFAPNGAMEFSIGSRIYDRETYDALVQARRSSPDSLKDCWKPRPGFFPEYRA